MLLKELREKVYQANLTLPKLGLVNFTWGNVSGCDRDQELFVIKPSGVAYQTLRPSDLVVVNFAGKVVEGHLRPSTDTATHAYLYRHFTQIGGITHTHSTWAVAFAAANLVIPTVSTTHADTFHGDVPCIPPLSADSLTETYEKATGRAIVDYFNEHSLDPLAIAASLVSYHGPFTWGTSPADSVYHAKVVEIVAEIAYHVHQLKTGDLHLPQTLMERHYQRKHGQKAYYGQKKRGQTKKNSSEESS